MAKFYERPILLLEGFTPGRSILNVSADAIRGALVSFAAVFRIPTLCAAGPSDAAVAILTAARQFRKAFEDGYVRAGYRPRGLRKRRLFVLQGLPGVGRRRATALLDHFGCPASVMSASAENLRRVPRIGPAVAAAIVRVARAGGSPASRDIPVRGL